MHIEIEVVKPRLLTAAAKKVFAQKKDKGFKLYQAAERSRHENNLLHEVYKELSGLARKQAHNFGV